MNARNGMRPVHPGEILRDELETLGLSANALSKALDVPVNRITAILHGQRGVTANTALRLARYFGTTPQVWLNLQKTYELRRAEIEAGREIAERRQAPANGGVDRGPLRYERKRSLSGARPTLTTKGKYPDGNPTTSPVLDSAESLMDLAGLRSNR